MNKMRFEGKTVYITGASTGIGRATAVAFGKECANVVIADINIEDGQKTAHMVQEAGGQAIFVKTDVKKTEEIQASIKKTVDTFGHLDCAYNNAGIGGQSAKIADYPEDDWDLLMATNLRGVFLATKYELRQMLAQGGKGAIVNCSSVGGIIGVPMASAYIAAKHAIVGFTKCAGLEYAKSGIRINAIGPHLVRTPMVMKGFAQTPELGEMLSAMTPIGRMSEPEELSGVVLWLCSDEASYVLGTTFYIDGGMSAP